MPEESLEVIKSQFLSGQIPQGSILAKVLADLSPQEVAALKAKAAEGMLGLELQRMAMQNKFQASALEMEMLVRNVRDMQREHSGAMSSYTIDKRIETASGETTITSKKGCYIATAVYGSEDHPCVVQLRRFRDERLETTPLGRRACAVYYRLSPRLAKSVFSRGKVRLWMRGLLDCLCRRL